jgi:hypothetical protein
MAHQILRTEVYSTNGGATIYSATCRDCKSFRAVDSDKDVVNQQVEAHQAKARRQFRGIEHEVEDGPTSITETAEAGGSL